MLFLATHVDAVVIGGGPMYSLGALGGNQSLAPFAEGLRSHHFWLRWSGRLARCYSPLTRRQQPGGAALLSKE